MMPNVSAPRREPPPVKERPSTEPTEDVEDADTEEKPDATRSVQDLIAAALKMFAKVEPKVEPAKVEVPQIQFAAAPTIEAAVQNVLDQIVAKPEPKADTTEDKSSSEKPVETAAPEGAIHVEPEMKLDAPMTSKGPVATTAVREPAPLPENPNPSHVHLVLDDGPERVVVTVAVRGNEVNATIRGGDEQTAAAIARNAASLDHALRANGLDLSSFASGSERDLDHHAPREQQEREKQQHAKFEEDLT